MADSFMPLWERRQQVRAMQIKVIVAPSVREPFMWNLSGFTGDGKNLHTERVHAHFIGEHKPEVGSYLICEGLKGFGYMGKEAFEAIHSRVQEEVADIEPLAGQVWNGPEIPRFLDKPIPTTGAAPSFGGVDIDAAHDKPQGRHPMDAAGGPQKSHRNG